jgi:hypothetical protein
MIDQSLLRHLRLDHVSTKLPLTMLSMLISKNKDKAERTLYFMIKDILFSAGSRVKNGAMLNLLFKCISVNKWVW